MKTIKSWLMVFAAIRLLTSAATAQTPPVVTFSLLKMTGQTNTGGNITISLDTAANFVANDFVLGDTPTLSWTNGFASTPLLPGPCYDVQIDGINYTWKFCLTNTSGTFDAHELINNYVAATTPIPPLAEGANITLVTNIVNGQAVVTISSSGGGGGGSFSGNPTQFIDSSIKPGAIQTNVVALGTTKADAITSGTLQTTNTATLNGVTAMTVAATNSVTTPQVTATGGAGLNISGGTGVTIGSGNNVISGPLAVQLFNTPGAFLTVTSSGGQIGQTSSLPGAQITGAQSIPVGVLPVSGGDTSGPLNNQTVATVGGTSAASIATGAGLANAATGANTANTIVKRDGSGNFTAGTVNATQFNGSGVGLTAMPANVLLTNGSGQTIFQPFSFASGATLTFGPPAPGGTVLQTIILQDNQGFWFFGTNGLGNFANISFQAEHPSMGELRFIFPQLSFAPNAGGWVQFGNIGATSMQASYWTRAGESSATVPFTASQLFDMQCSFWDNNAEVVDHFQMQAVPISTNYIAPASAVWRFAGMTHVNQSGYSPVAQSALPIMDLADQAWIQNYYGTVYSEPIWTVASNSTYYADLLHSYQEVRLNGPATVTFTNMNWLNSTTNKNVGRFEMWLSSGLIGNCGLSFAAAPAALTLVNDIGLAITPTNVPPGMKMGITFTGSVGLNSTNILGRYTVVPETTAIDTDAAAFFTAIGAAILPQESNTVNFAIKDAKRLGVWTMADCLYPEVGGTSNSCAINAVNPALYRFSWPVPSGVTFTHAGVLTDGSTGYGDTHFSPATATTPHYAQDSATMLVWSGTATPTVTGNQWVIGCVSTPKAGMNFQTGSHIDGYGFNNADGVGAGNFITYSAVNGLLAITRTAAIQETLYANNQVDVDIDASTGVPNANVYLGAVNSSGPFGFTGMLFQTVLIGGGMNTQQEAAWAWILAQLNGGLGR